MSATDKRDKISANIINATTLQLSGVPISALLGFQILLGDGFANVFTIPHGLGTANIIEKVKKVSTDSTIDVQIESDETNIIVSFAVAPAVNSYKLIVIGF